MMISAVIRIWWILIRYMGVSSNEEVFINYCDDVYINRL